MDKAAAAEVASEMAQVAVESSSRSTAKFVAANLMTSEIFYENFLEILAQVTSTFLTDEETEKIAESLKKFHSTLQRVTSRSNVNGGASSPVGGMPAAAAGPGSPWAPLPTPGDATSPQLSVPVPDALQCAHPGTCSQHCARGWVRTFAVGYLIKYTVGTLPVLFNGRKLLQRPSLLFRELNRDTVQFALFLSTFTSGYKGLFCVLRRRLTDVYVSRPDWWSPDELVARRLKKVAAFLAGLLASLAILIDKNEGRRTAIALYFLTRAIEFGVKFVFVRWRKRWEQRWGVASAEAKDTDASKAIAGAPLDSGVGASAVMTNDDVDDEDGAGSPLTIRSKQQLPSSATTTMQKTNESVVAAVRRRLDALGLSAIQNIPAFMAASSGALVMMLSSSQILFSYVAMPDTLAPSYMGFLLEHGGQKDRMGPLVAHLLRLMGRTVWRTTGHAPLADVYCPMPEGAGGPHGVGGKVSATQWAMCGLIHPAHDKCHEFTAECFGRSMRRSAKLYAPLNLAMTLVFNHARARRDPLRTLARMLVSTLRSSVFLAGYVTTAWTATCTLRNVFGREHISFYLINGMLSGAWSLLEAPGRRLDLGLYCLPRALEAMWRALIKGGVVPRLPRDPAKVAQLSVGRRALATVLSKKAVGEPVYFALSTALLMMLYDTEGWVISPGYKSVMSRFFGVN
ncbi:hypothetical protein BC828DRAFT_153780 [Blastocladiella britannica]|nr:hypothetical protein BC828DRAFT_153780 [Blastocladiella britannica]